MHHRDEVSWRWLLRSFFAAVALAIGVTAMAGPPAGRVSLSTPPLMIQTVGQSATTSFTITNLTGVPHRLFAALYPAAPYREGLACSDFVTLSIPADTCTFDYHCTMRRQKVTVQPNESLTVYVEGGPQPVPTWCTQGLWVYDDAGAEALGAVPLVERVLPSVWYDRTVDFETARGNAGNITLNGVTFISKPANTCMFADATQYGDFRHLSGRALVCWGQSVRMEFPSASLLAFNYARPTHGDSGLSGVVGSDTMQVFTNDSEGPPSGYASWVETYSEALFAAPGTNFANLSSVKFAEVGVAGESGLPLVIDNVSLSSGAPPLDVTPVVSEVQPPVAMPGASIRIEGSGLLGGVTTAGEDPRTESLVLPTVTVGGRTAMVVEASNTDVIAIVPDLPLGPANIVVTTPDGRSTSTNTAFAVGVLPPKRRTVRH